MLRSLIISELVKGYVRGYMDWIPNLAKFGPGPTGEGCKKGFVRYYTADNHIREYREKHALDLMLMLAEDVSDRDLLEALRQFHIQEMLHAK